MRAEAVAAVGDAAFSAFAARSLAAQLASRAAPSSMAMRVAFMTRFFPLAATRARSVSASTLPFRTAFEKHLYPERN